MPSTFERRSPSATWIEIQNDQRNASKCPCKRPMAAMASFLASRFLLGMWGGSSRLKDTVPRCQAGQKRPRAQGPKGPKGPRGGGVCEEVSKLKSVGLQQCSNPFFPSTLALEILLY